MNRLISLLFISIWPNYTFAQHSFTITNASSNYTIIVQIDKCGEISCDGNGIIKLMDKKSNAHLQTFTSKGLTFDISRTKKKGVNRMSIKNPSDIIFFDDFNFDNQVDLAIFSGSSSSYSTPSHDIYVFNRTKQKFVKSAELTELASNNLGMFTTDRRRKRIICHDKSGCCWRLTTEYEVVFRKGLRKILEIEEKSEDGEQITLTRRELKNGKWVTKVKKYTQK